MMLRKSFMRKRKGSGILLSVITAAFVSGLIGVSVARLHGISFGGLASVNESMQAQQVAANLADRIRATSYDSVESESRIPVPGLAGYYQTINVVPDDFNGVKSVEISVDNGDASNPNVSLHLERLRVSEKLYGELGNNTDGAMTQKAVTEAIDEAVKKSLPVGAIISYHGTKVPDGWAVCDGTHGTPDLRDRFIVGAGSTYALGATGGANKVLLDGTQIGNHYHAFGYNSNGNSGNFFADLTSGGSLLNSSFKMESVNGNPGIIRWNGSGWDNAKSINSNPTGNMITSTAIATAAQESHENRPPYYALYYIMKIS